MRTIVRIVVSAFAFWIATLVVGGSGQHGIWVEPYGNWSASEVASGGEAASAYVVTLLLIALVFGIVDGTLGKVVRFVSIPLRIITLGLFSVIINGLMIALVSWISNLAGFGLRLEGFWWGVLASIVISVISSIINGLLGTKKERKK